MEGIREIYYAPYDNSLVLIYFDGAETRISLDQQDYIKDVSYNSGCLEVIKGNGQAIFIPTDVMVKDTLDSILPQNNEGSTEYTGKGPNSLLAKITSKVLSNFLSSPEGIRAIEEELNIYFETK